MEQEIRKQAISLISQIIEHTKPRLQQFSSNRILENIIENTKNFSMIRSLLHKDSVSLNKIYIHPDFKHEENYINNINDILKLYSKVTIIAKGCNEKITFMKKINIDTLYSFEKIFLILNLRDFNHLEIKRKIEEASIKNNFIFKALANQLVEFKVTID